MLIHDLFSNLVFSVYGYASIFVQNSDHNFRRFTAYLYQVKVFVLTFKNVRLGIRTIQRNKIPKLFKKKLTPYEGNANVAHITTSFSDIQAPITIDYAPPKVPVFLKTCNHGRMTFLWNYAEFSKVGYNFIASELKSKMWFALYFLTRVIGVLALDIIVRLQKVPEFVYVPGIFFGGGKVHSVFKYVSIRNEHSDPIGALRCNIRKAIFVNRIATACSHFYRWYRYESHGKPHLLVGQGRTGADNTLRPALIIHGARS